MRSDLSRRRHWLIARDEDRRTETLILDFGVDSEALPVFGHEEEAEMFLLLGRLGEGWYVTGVDCPDLASVLLGLGASVKKVALDPLPPGIVGEGFTDLVSMDRREFVRLLVGGRKRPAPASGRSPSAASAGLFRASGRIMSRSDAIGLEPAHASLQRSRSGPPQHISWVLRASTGEDL